MAISSVTSWPLSELARMTYPELVAWTEACAELSSLRARALKGED